MSFKSAEMSAYVSQVKKDLFADAEWLLDDFVASEDAIDAELKRTSKLHEEWRDKQKHNVAGPRLGLSGQYGHTFAEVIEAGLPLDDLKVVQKPPFTRPEAPVRTSPVPLCPVLTRELSRLVKDVMKYLRRVIHFRSCLMIALPIAKEGEAQPEGFISLTREVESAVRFLDKMSSVEERYFKSRLSSLQNCYANFQVSQTEEMLTLDEETWQSVSLAPRHLQRVKLVISDAIRKHEKELNELRTYEEQSQRKESALAS